jgi:hypothetical protein
MEDQKNSCLKFPDLVLGKLPCEINAIPASGWGISPQNLVQDMVWMGGWCRGIDFYVREMIRSSGVR